MELFDILNLVDIIFVYIQDDIICDDILKMDWDTKIISNLRVSYLSYILTNYPDKLDMDILAENPELTPDLIALLKDHINFRNNPLYPRDKLIDIRTSGVFTGYNICWKNPNLLYQELVDGKHPINWYELCWNQSLSYEFLKKHQDKIKPEILALHPNAGDLLDNSKALYRLGNPNLSFDRIPNIDKLIEDDNKCNYLSLNRNLPVKYVRLYVHYGKSLYLIYMTNSNISQILKEFPVIPDSDDEEVLLCNPAYYTHCIRDTLRKLFSTM